MITFQQKIVSAVFIFMKCNEMFLNCLIPSTHVQRSVVVVYNTERDLFE